MFLHELKSNIAKQLAQALDRTDLAVGDFEYPPDAEMGDLSLPLFRLAQELKKSPSDLARALLSGLSGSRPAGVATIKTAGPYLNFILDKGYLFSELNKSLASGGFGCNQNGQGRQALVEFANQNTHKEFHVGHLRNICFGDAICRLLQANGYAPTAVSYINDFGIHVAKTLWAYLAYYGEAELPANKGRFLGEIYARASAEIKADPHKADLAKFMMKKIESRSGSEYELWAKTRVWSIEQFERIYQELNVEFRRTFYESDYIDQGRELVLKLKDQGILKSSQGALIADLEAGGLGVLVVLRSDGTATYPVADIPLAAAKQAEFDPDISIYVTDNRQELYFKQLFHILRQMGHKEEMKHLKYDFVKLPSGMMSSRSGNTVTYEELKEALTQELAGETRKRHQDWPEDQVKEIASALAIATIKYEMLKVSSEQAITFDIQAALSFQGNTAAYILYTNARIKSIRRRSGVKELDPAELGQIEPIEGQLLMKLAKFPDIVAEAGARLDPSVASKYAFELAQMINDYYHQVPIIKSEEKDKLGRLKLLENCSEVLELALNLLGIKGIEKM